MKIGIALSTTSIANNCSLSLNFYEDSIACAGLLHKRRPREVLIPVLYLDSRGFAIWKIRHKEDLLHNECDREFERKRWTNVCNCADVEDASQR